MAASEKSVKQSARVVEGEPSLTYLLQKLGLKQLRLSMTIDSPSTYVIHRILFVSLPLFEQGVEQQVFMVHFKPHRLPLWLLYVKVYATHYVLPCSSHVASPIMVFV